VSHLERAQLLAELGRYDEAADELIPVLAVQPADAEALTLLALILRAADKPYKAIEAADAAVAAAPLDLHAIGVRGLILVDLERYGEAAATAEMLLSGGPDDAHAQITAALILGQSRNGQQALNAAWRGVSLAPENAQAHLVLGFVCRNLRLDDLSERAYREALRLDPHLSAARQGLGLIRLDKHEYSDALDHLVEAAAMEPSDMDGGRLARFGIRRLLFIGAGYAFVTAPVAALSVAVGGWLGRLGTIVLALVGFGAIALVIAPMRDNVSRAVSALVRGSRGLTIGFWAAAAEPAFLLGFAILGSPWLLVALLACGAVALLTSYAE